MANEFKSSEPNVSWLAHVLTENVGKNEWVPKNVEEMEAYKKTLPASMRHDPYPYKVVTSPIPPGSDIVLEDSKKYIIACNNEEIRNMMIGLAQRYKELTEQSQRTTFDAVWKPASESPEHRHAAYHHKTVIVDSGILHYVGGLNLGYHDLESNKWYLYTKGKTIEHSVEFWREIPIGPSKTPKYEDVKEQVEQLRLDINSEPANFSCFAHTLLMDIWRSGVWKRSQRLRDSMQDLAEAINSVSPGTFPASFDELVKDGTADTDE